jgi:alginate O-acetyltransferase complex protein AlgI
VLFPTIDFAIFFGIVFVLNWLLAPFPKPWRVVMLAASYFFYAWWDWHFIFLLMASTLITVVGGRAINKARAPIAKRNWLIVTVIADLGMLGWFKYYGFFSLTFDNTVNHFGFGHPVPLLQVILPIGISFFTFMALSYVIDIYRGSLEPAPWLDVAVYLSFFPHLIAGPIVRGSDLLPQIRRANRRDPRRIALPRAAYLIFAGLFKKVVLSSYVSSAIVDPVFANPHSHSALEVLFAIWGFAVQIYCDFSGYTDIAIGLALLLGFRFPENFDGPYTARSLQDFWRRWHITLSLWLRDYLYIPLGGNQGSRGMLYRNIIITMVLGGLWHGAAWTFIIWGAIHGFGQCIGHARRANRIAMGLPPQAEGRWALAWQRFATFQIVCLGWIFFRSTSMANAVAMLGRLATGWGQASPLVRFPVVLAIVVGIGIQYLPKGLALRTQEVFSRLSLVMQGAALAVILLIITTLGPPGVAPFIYYRF